MAKEEADNLKKISIYWLKKEKLLNHGWYRNSTITWTHGWSETKSSIGIEISQVPNDMYARLYYTQTNSNDEKRDYDYKVPIISTRCHFGGQRQWFVCPLSINGKYCGKRVGVLYKAGDYFGCRHCYNLTYESRNKNRSAKLYPLFITLEKYQKVEELEKQMKRRYYANKPTKKQQTLDKLYAQTLRFSPQVRRLV